MQKVTLSTDLKSGFFWTQMMLSIIQNPHLIMLKKLRPFFRPKHFLDFTKNVKNENVGT